LFFEGSEKKVEVSIESSYFSLINDISDQFWSELVNKANAKILSCIQNDECKAFILSESSLFVWHNRFVILTCGVTHLINAVEYFIQEQGSHKINYLTYQRKNEYYSYVQPSCFGDDVKTLSHYITGSAIRFGEMDSHHTFLFYKSSESHARNRSYELLAYQISKEASDNLTNPNITSEEIREFLQLDKLLPGFIIDDHIFDPYGYSVNAIKEGMYLTIHVTPQAESSYVSFESNINTIKLSSIILDILKPKSFDLLCFNNNEFKSLIIEYIDKRYVSKSLVEERLNNGCTVYFANYILPQVEFIAATPFNLLGDDNPL
jgi:S-adenosylmethionine decarboxylase